MRPPGAGGSSAPEGYAPDGYTPEGYDPSGYGRPANAAPPKPKTLREKALDAFRAGNQEDALELLTAHYLTVPAAGTELGRNMQWCAALRRPTLAPRFGVAVIYGTPHNFDGDPQPLGSPELEAALAELDSPNNRGGEGRQNNRKLGAGRRKNREGNREGNRQPMGPQPGMNAEGFPGGMGQQEQVETPLQELEYYTGEVGTKLLARLRLKMEASTFGAVLKDANKAMPAAPKENDNNNINAGGFAGAGGGMRPPMGMQPGFRGGSAPPGAEFSDDGEFVNNPRNNGGEGMAAGLSSQLLPGVTWLGPVENVKELSELVSATPVDVIFVFDVKVRPATASNWVNNDTRLRVVTAAKVTEALFTSASLNNKGVTEARK
jgi:hypothetical protein